MDKLNILCLIFICVIFNIKAEEDEDYIRVQSELELINYDLSDECSDISKNYKNYIMGNSDLNSKISLETDYGKLLRTQSAKIQKYEDVVPYELQRNWTLLSKPGDSLLNEEQYKQLVMFANNVTHGIKTSKIDCQYEACEYKEQDVLDILRNSKNDTLLKFVWSEWQRNTEIYQEEYRSNLKLVSTAASLNDLYDARSYWEMLIDIENAYSEADELWQEVEPLYIKLEEFVKTRLNKYYGTNFTTIPVYLLGSNFGEDWSNIADILLPHPQFHYEAKVKLNSSDIRYSYRCAENFTKGIGFRRLGKHFWKHSVFNYPICDPEILNYCTEEHSEIVTCKSNTLENYLRAHENVMEIVLNEKEYLTLAQNKLRESVVTKSLINMASLYGMNNLVYYGILDETIFTAEVEGRNNKMTALLLVALRILPKLAYYYSADKWRLQELEYPTENIAKSWWEIRKTYQRVEGVTNDEIDFLQDKTIVYNKPHLSNFLALILQFQFLSHYQITMFQDASNIAVSFKEDTFREMIDNIHTRGAIELLNYYYNFDEISAYPLKEFFAPLEEYFDAAPEDQVPIIVRTTTKIPTSTESLETTFTKNSIPTVTSNTPQEARDLPAKDTQTAGNYTVIVILLCIVGAAVGICLWKKLRRRLPSRNRRDDV